MLVRPNDFSELYEGIKTELDAGDERKLEVFISTAECDSVCALRIFQTICKLKGVHYNLYPVTRYDELIDACKRQFSEDDDQSQIRTVLLINCGAMEDMREMLGLARNIRIVVIDSHRPIHHTYNAPGDMDTILMYDPQDGTPDDIPQDLGTSDSDDDDESSEDDAEEPAAQRQRLSPSTSRPGVSRYRQRREAREAERQRRLQYYERGSYYGQPAAAIFYKLAHSLGLDDNRLLWFKIVGLTDQLVHQHISQEKYLEYVMEIETEVSNNGNLDMEESVLVQDGHDGPSTSVNKPLYCRIMPMDDFRFMLLRHWSLYDSLLHSSYVAVRLQTWADRGRVTIEDMLMAMGYTLQQSCRLWSNMQPKFQRNLQSKLQANAANYMLPDTTFRSFQLQTRISQARDVTACDVVYGVTALLESSGRIGAEAMPHERFWRAWKALGEREPIEMQTGIELAKRVQKAIISNGGWAVMRRHITEYSRFRVCNLSEQEAEGRDLLAHPAALVRLAAFLYEAYFQDRKKHKPLVLIGPKDMQGRCLIVGFTGQPRLLSPSGNKFGNAFQQAADSISTDARHDRFDTSVIEIAATDILRFVRELVHGANNR